MFRGWDVAGHVLDIEPGHFGCFLSIGKQSPVSSSRRAQRMGRWSIAFHWARRGEFYQSCQPTKPFRFRQMKGITRMLYKRGKRNQTPPNPDSEGLGAIGTRGCSIGYVNNVNGPNAV